LFFAYAAECLQPLYRAFVKKHKWGDVGEFERILEYAWNVLDTEGASNVADAISRLSSLTPSGEQFDSPDSTYAQDATVCVDAALRAMSESEELRGDWLDYVIEPVRTKISLEKWGFLSVEGPGRNEWDAELIREPEVVAFLEDCQRIILLLTPSNRPLASVLRNEARRNSLRPNEYIR
jgi:uncharacterized protein YjaG (DUF416 family)